MLTRSPGDILNRLPAEYRTRDPDADIIAMRLTQAMLSPTGRMTLEAAEAVRGVLAVTQPGVREGRADLERTFTNRFVQQ